ncbi:MAG: sulfatase-like hydrolase/transferase [Clostridia bacterium]|jgi:phosphoglycerol transferase MdoB-like AlkP superfamily enzyme|nr:sulfatase-like hydrolase/transferase [Clostridia bacterium]MCI1999323.1 sulfatase-like hydrolase/transferase [Clostridia bacterium]MCI2015175.1 sulfatase-like hydrolase/transferase [Clostridia bacterium]
MDNNNFDTGGMVTPQNTPISDVGHFKKIRTIIHKTRNVNLKEHIYTSKTQLLISSIIFVAVYMIFNFILKTQMYETAFISAAAAVSIGAPVKIKTGELGRIIASLIVCLLSIPLSFLIVETLNGNVIWYDLTHIQIILNLAWYTLIALFWLFILRKPYYAAVVSSAVFLGIGIANHYVLSFRGTIIFPGDLMSFGTAFSVADNFNFTPDKAIIFSACAFVAYFILSRKVCKGITLKRRKFISLAYIIVSCVFLYGFFNTDILPSLGIYAQQWKTQANGYVLNFTTALRYSHMEKPVDYSAQATKDIMSSITPDAAPIGTKPTNIIVIMNESFADFSDFDDLSLSDDPCPFYHSLTKNTIKGHMYSPVAGGGTANVEYEYLTGNSMSFVPQGTVPYQLYLKEGAPSMVNQMNKLGYHTTAVHPYLASGWNRNNVYDFFGFDDKYFEPDIKNPEIVRKYISDSCDYENLFDITDKDDNPHFIFNVTMQNHSSYDVSWPLQKYHIKPVDNCEILDKITAAQQYFSLIRESDDAIKELIEHYSNSDEKTLIVFFGDHQPPLGNKFYQYLYKKSLDSRSIDEVLEEYNTPFFIWANYDIPEEQNVKISTNFLGVLAMKTANLPLTGYQTFLDRLHCNFPVYSTIATIDNNGKAVSRQDDNLLDNESQKMIQEYSYLNYFNLFGNKENDDFYTLTDKSLKQYNWTLKVQNKNK